MTTLAQQIAQAEDRLNRLRNKNRNLENGQKIILGGMLINAARKNTKIREWLLTEAGKSITREADMKRLEPLLESLRRVTEEKTEATKETVSEALTTILSDHAISD